MFDRFDRFDRVRTMLHGAITTPVGDGLLPVRVPKDLTRRFNMLLGEPLCSAHELERRRAGAARLESLRRAATSGEPAKANGAGIAAPVMVYFEKDRNTRLLGRIQDTLEARRIPFTLLDVAGD